MSKITTSMFLEDLIGSKIVTADGKSIGRVVDIQVSTGPEHEVSALIFGKYAWLYRLHVLRPFARTFGFQHQPCIVPWSAVDRFERFVVTLKAGQESRIESGSEDLHA
jgi:sporulation protein YlmC with PRC-barrel domain